MTTIIDTPDKISKALLGQLLDLVETGSQVDPEGLEERIMNAELIAVMVDNDKIVTTATLKNPLTSYRNKIFKSAGVDGDKENFKKEIGYIVTHPKYEGQKLCQKLLTEFMPHIDRNNIFATTRKPSMVHILTKFGFKKSGDTNEKELDLLTFIQRHDSTHT
jgi:predicted GNAT family N-acyltransferase